MDAATLLSVWRSSRWVVRECETGITTATREPVDGRRRYPRAEVLFDGSEAVASVELWAPGSHASTLRAGVVRRWGAPGFKNIKTAMDAVDADVPRLLEKASAKARREKGGA